jgi:hypothetical protein
MKLLRIDSSARRSSVSRQLTTKFVDSWKQGNPNGEIIERDLATTQLPLRWPHIKLIGISRKASLHEVKTSVASKTNLYWENAFAKLRKTRKPPYMGGFPADFGVTPMPRIPLEPVAGKARRSCRRRSKGTSTPWAAGMSPILRDGECCGC